MSDKIDHAILGAKACFDLNFLKRVEACHKLELKMPLLLPDICNVCYKFQNEHQREPMIFHEIPSERFYKVDVSDSINAEQSRQQFYYNKRRKTLKPLKKGKKCIVNKAIEELKLLLWIVMLNVVHIKTKSKWFYSTK